MIWHCVICELIDIVPLNNPILIRHIQVSTDVIIWHENEIESDIRSSACIPYTHWR